MISDFLNAEELALLGLAAIGRQVQVSRRAVFFAPNQISLGDYARVDAFCILSAGPPGLRVGRNVHISAYTAILGREAVMIEDFATISVRCTILSSNDDYSGATMGNATVPAIYRGAVEAPVRIHAHAMIGAGSILMPGVTVGESACVGATSLVKTNVAPFEVVAGVPARVIGRRGAEHRVLADKLLQEEAFSKDGLFKSPE